VAFDGDLLALTITVNRIDGAADQAVWIGARATTGGYKPFVDAEAVANQARDASVRVTASFGAFITAGAGLEI
jgi:hypothetical protein